MEKTESESVKELIASLISARKEIKTLTKNKTGFGYSYVDLADIMEEIVPKLAKYDLFLTNGADFTEQGIQYVSAKVYHKSGEYLGARLIIPEVVSTKANKAQIMGMGITYLRRYLTCALLGLVADEDTDANVMQSMERMVNQQRQQNSYQRQSSYPRS